MSPQIILEKPTQIHGPLVVAWENGKKVLNSGAINYSYGSLQKILEQGLQKLLMGKNIKSILILGLGAGSIIETLRQSFQINAPITAVEMDADIIQIARDEFQLDQWQQVHIVQQDAFEFMMNNQNAFDLVVIDLFLHNKIPTKATEILFIQHLSKSFNLGGVGIFNTLRETLSVNERKKLEEKFVSLGFKTRVMEEIGFTNDLILLEKKE